ncbi:MAG: hypothetical protein FIB02_10660 [Desulfuromonas sp.]|nr:hypothetical protein [Desulfuromonas sp.]
MKRVRYLLMMGVWVLMAMGLATTTFAATLNGTVTNSSGQAGRVYLRVFWAGDVPAPGHWGRSIMNGVTSYSIRGVPAGNYVVAGFVDKNGDGIPNISEGVGVSASFALANDGTVTPAGSSDLTLYPQNPPAVVPQTPAFPGAMPLDGGALLMWESPLGGPYGIFVMADSYKVEWSANDFATVLGSKTVTAGNGKDYGVFFVPNLDNGTTYSFKVTSIVGASESVPAEITATPHAPMGGLTISGTVNLDAALDAVGHPFVVVAEGVAGQSFFMQVISSITNGAAFSVPDVDPGLYHLWAFVDMNGDNQPSAGDYWTTVNPEMTVVGTNITGQTLTIEKPNGIAAIETDHVFGEINQGYGVAGYVESGAKRPVNAYITGPAFSEGVDMAWTGDDAYYWQWTGTRPQLTDVYSFLVYYSDGSSETVTASPTAVYDAPVANSITPSGTITAMPANITWTPSATAPAGWLADVNITGVDNGFWWEPDTDFPPDTTSIPYEGPALTPGNYRITVQLCEDWSWNCVSRSQNFAIITGTCATPKSLTVPPADPDGSYMVSWQSSATPGVIYVLEEATDPLFTTELRTIPSGTGLSQAISGRTYGKTYYYRVKATKDGYADSGYRTGVVGCAYPGTTIVGSPASIVVPPADSDGTYDVKWTASATQGATYVLEEASNPAFTLNLRVVYSGPGLKKSFTARPASKTYYYRVKAIVAGAMDSAWRTNMYGCAVPGTELTGAPAGITVPTADPDGGYTVEWLASATPNVTYVLEEALDPAFINGVRTAYVGTGLSTPISGRRENKTYYYRVKAILGAGTMDSVYTVPINGCAIPGTYAVSRPVEILVPTVSADGTLEVSWTASATANVTYFLQEATNPAFTAGLRTAYYGPDLSTLITGRKVGKTYYYRVQAVRAGRTDSLMRKGLNGCLVGGPM